MTFRAGRTTFCIRALAVLIGLSAAQSSRAAVTVPTSPADPTAALAKIVQDYSARGKFDGVVLVARGGHLLYQGAVGLANRETGALNRADTAYPICSITKQFTAVLVMQQVERGKISLNAPISRYLPDFRQDTARRITIENLLTHTSGLANSDGFVPPPTDSNAMPPFYTANDPSVYQARYVIDHYLTGNLQFVPGSKFSYNNADYIVLSEVLRRVTGKDFPTLLRDNIACPLHMDHTGAFIDTGTGLPAAYAQGYVHFKGGFVNPDVYAEKMKANLPEPEPSVNLAVFGAAGAMYSTAGDLLRWNLALLGHKLLGNAAQKQLFTPVASLGYEGLSTWIYNASFSGSPAKPLLYERDGAIDAYQTLDLLAPHEGVSLIILSNTDNSELGHIYERSGLAYELLRSVYTSPVD